VGDRVPGRAQSLATSPGSAEALSGDANIDFTVVDEIFDVEGAPAPPLPVSDRPMPVGAPRRLIRVLWLCPLRAFWHFLCLLVDGVAGMVWGGGRIQTWH
jgi:hypothetical protein